MRGPITFEDLAVAGGFHDEEADKREKLLTVDRMVEKGKDRVRSGPNLFEKHDETDESPNGELYAGFTYTPSGKVQYVKPKSIKIKDWVLLLSIHSRLETRCLAPAALNAPLRRSSPISPIIA